MVSQNGTAGFDIPPSNETASDGTGSPAPESTATAAPVAFPQIQSEAPTQESLQERIAELEARDTKRENDYKSLQGRLRQQGDDSKFEQLSEGLSTVSDTLNAFIRLQGTQDEEQFREDLQKVETNSTTRKQSSTFQRTSKLMIDEINASVQEHGLDLETSPELDEFRNLWGPAWEGNDIAGLYAAHAAFTKVMLGIEKNLRTKTEESLEERLKQLLEEHGVNSLDTDLTPIPSSSGPNNLLSRLGNSEATVSRDEISQAAEILRKQGIRL